MGLKTAGVGHFTIPTAPAAGTSVTSGAANVFTTTYVALSAAAPAAIFITGMYVEQAAVTAATYIVVQLATGTAGSEVIVGQHLIAPVTGSTVARAYKAIYPPVPVANGIRIAAKTADSVGALASLITLECINQSNVVDDGVAVGTVTTVSAVTGLTASNLDVAVSSRMATYTQPTGFLAASFPTSVASPTNITAASGVALAASQHVIVDSGTVTTLSNLPSIPANWLTAAGIAAGALNGKGDWSTYAGGDTSGTTTLLSRLTSTRAGLLDNLDAAISTRSTYAGGDTAGTTTLLGRITSVRAGLLDNLDAAVTTRLASASYTAPDNASVVAIKAKTDSLTFTSAGKVDAGLYYVNGVAITGAGTDVSPWKAP